MTNTSQWRDVLISQGRSLRWLATATGTKPRTVYAYSAWSKDPALQNARRPPVEWLARVSEALGVEVTE